MRRPWFVLLSLVLAACSESPTGLQRDVAIQVEEAESSTESATVEGAPGAVVVRGVYTAPTSGYTLRASYFDGDDGHVVVHVHGKAPDAAFHVITGHAYRVTVPLPAGTHTVHVMHDDDREAGVREVAVQQVTVAR